MRRLHQFRTVSSAETDWCLTRGQIVGGGGVMHVDCVALTARSTTKSVLLHIEQFVMARVPLLANGCKSNQRFHDTGCRVLTMKREAGGGKKTRKRSRRGYIHLFHVSIKASSFLFNPVWTGPDAGRPGTAGEQIKGDYNVVV